MRYLTVDEVLELGQWNRPQLDRAASTYLPRRLRVKIGPVYEFVPVTPLYLRLTSLLRESFGQTSKEPARLAEQALPQLERLLTSTTDPAASITIQVNPFTLLDIRHPFASEIRAALKQMQ
jgi:hypothetical protein